GIGLLGLGGWLWLVRGQAVAAGHGAGATRAVLIFGLAAGAAWAVVAVRGEWLRGWMRGVLLLGIVSAELITTSQYIEVDWGNPIAGYQNEAATHFLQANTGLARIDEATGLWQASSAQMNGLYSAGGVFNPLELASHAALAGSVGYRGSPTYSLMGIQYIVADKSEPPGDTHFLRPIYTDDPQVDIYLNTNVLPRVMMLYQTQVVASQDEAFAALFEGYDFEQTLIVEQGEPLAGETAAHQIDLIAYENNRVVLDVQTEQRGYLLLTDMWYPNWVATVDGVSAEIYRANYAFRAILLESGTHRIEMRFQPRSWQIGAVISVMSWVLVIGGLGWNRVRRLTAKTRRRGEERRK
ncbi:MAG TPA: hypothetical protein ENJ56_04645, partial [Anaerolineae bacterium]|nr:hypothetical protein [Anaerolineae bacterium]